MATLMPVVTPWFKMYSADWLEGTRALEPELRGIYIDLLCLMSERDGPVPDNDGWIAHQLHISKRRWRSARDRLVSTGKLSATPAGLINSRAAVELEKRANRRRVNAENGAKNHPNVRENSKMLNDANEALGRSAKRNSRYARARQSDPESEDSDIEFVEDDCAQSACRTIPENWRAAELEWLLSAMPGDRLEGRNGLVDWLWRLELEHGPSAITTALDRIRRPVELGNVKHPRAYFEEAIARMTTKRRVSPPARVL